jgi:hypothetical protein
MGFHAFRKCKVETKFPTLGDPAGGGQGNARWRYPGSPNIFHHDRGTRDGPGGDSTDPGVPRALGGAGAAAHLHRGELEYCLRQADPAPSLAARFAAKEAFFKAVGQGWGRGGDWREVEVDGRRGARRGCGGRGGRPGPWPRSAPAADTSPSATPDRRPGPSWSWRSSGERRGGAGLARTPRWQVRGRSSDAAPNGSRAPLDHLRWRAFFVSWSRAGLQPRYGITFPRSHIDG